MAMRGRPRSQEVVEMKRVTCTLAGLAVALVGAATPMASAPAGGDGTAYTFQQAPVNAMGVTGMADLRGKPVLIDFWGTH